VLAQPGSLGLAHRGFSLRDVRRHIVHTLRPAGYETVLCGVNHISARPEEIGYDRIISYERFAEENTREAVRYLSGRPRSPFFLSLGYRETHRPFPEAPDSRFVMPPPPLPDYPETRKDFAGFAALARVFDSAVGEVLQALERSALAGNTLVIATSDHGIPFPHMKCNLTDHGLGVFLIGQGKVCDALVSHIDLFPTIAELCGIEPPHWLEGRSILPVIRGERKEINDQIYGEVTFHASYEPQRCVRTKRWKYIRRFDGRGGPNPPNCDDRPSKALLMESGWRQRTVDEEALYDLVFDPQERENIVARRSAMPIGESMRSRLDSWMRATNDPLLAGPVPLPPGAKANDPEGTSPNEKPIGAP
jgi:arylsulfatase A-like enzyme